MKLKKLVSLFLVCLFFVAVTSIFFAPLLKSFSKKIISDIDALSITWNLNTIIKNFPALPEKLMEGNIYYPFRYSAAYTDPFITDSLVAKPAVYFINEPLVAFNFNLFISQIMFLVFSYFLLMELTSNKILSVLISLIFSFSKIRLHYFYVGHLQMFSLYWVPLSLFALLRFSKSQKPLFLHLFFFSFLAQTLNNFLAGYFILFLFLGLFLLDQELRLSIKGNFFHFLLGALLVGIFIFPFIQLYLKVAYLYKFSRSIQDAIHFSLSPEGIFESAFFSPLLFIIFIFSLILFFKKKKKTKKETSFLILSLFFLIMAFGPALHWFQKTVKINFFGNPLPIPLPYAIFYYLFPGFKGFRTPSRWIFMFGFTMSIFAALVINSFLSRLAENPVFGGNKGDKETNFSGVAPEYRASLPAGKAGLLRGSLLTASKEIKKVFFLIAFCLFFFNFNIPKDYFDFPLKKDYPAVYSWLKDQPGEVIIEIPIYWGDAEKGKLESARMVYSLFHQKKTVGGHCSFFPKEWENLIVFLRKELPSYESIFKIKSLGVDYLVVHEDELKDFWQNDYQEKIKILEKSVLLKEIYRKDKDVVFSFQENI